MHPALDIANHVCLITGGTSGIGRSLALGFAQAGAKVIAASTNPDKVAAIKKELGSGHDAVPLDVTDPNAVRAAFEQTVKKFGRLDAVVNAAGATKVIPSLDCALEDFERIIKLNLTGNFIVAQAAARIMKDQSPDPKGVRGAILNIASLSSFVGLSNAAAYTCSKSAVMGLTKCLATEWAPLGIRVNAIAPGVFPTDLNRALIEGTPRGQWFKAHTPMSRFGQTDELVGAAIYLLSPSASFTTGETLIVDGGFLAKGV